MVVHWLATGRLMAVSGRITSLVNRVRFGANETPEMTEQELLEAVRMATTAEFGELEAAADSHNPPGLGPEKSEAPDSPADDAHQEPNPALPQMGPRTTSHHVFFMVAVAVGGLMAASLGGRTTFTWSLASNGFRDFAGNLSPAILVIGGALVGFGTRMAGGCTSGHGLCGVSRFQPGSLLATAVFFSVGVGVSLLLGPS